MASANIVISGEETRARCLGAVVRLERLARSSIGPAGASKAVYTGKDASGVVQLTSVSSRLFESALPALGRDSPITRLLIGLVRSHTQYSSDGGLGVVALASRLIYSLMSLLTNQNLAHAGS